MAAWTYLDALSFMPAWQFMMNQTEDSVMAMACCV